MDAEMLADQQRLVALVEEAGWEVTDVELTAYESPWADEDDPEAAVTISAKRSYADESGTDEDSQFRVR